MMFNKKKKIGLFVATVALVGAAAVIIKGKYLEKIKKLEDEKQDCLEFEELSQELVEDLIKECEEAKEETDVEV